MIFGVVGQLFVIVSDFYIFDFCIILPKKNKEIIIIIIIHQFLMLHSIIYSTTSLPAAFVVGPLVLTREKHPCNTKQVTMCTSTNAHPVKSAMIVLVWNSVSEVLSEDGRLSTCYLFLLHILYLDYIAEKYVQNFQLYYLLCLCMRENLLRSIPHVLDGIFREINGHSKNRRKECQFILHFLDSP